MEEYVQVSDDEWFEVADLKDFKLQCCSCGLVHDIAFKIRGKRLELRFRQDKDETARIRLEAIRAVVGK